MYGFYYKSSEYSKFILLRDKYSNILHIISFVNHKFGIDLYNPKEKIKKIKRIMNNLTINTNPTVEMVLNNYPDEMKNKILYLRRLIVETAREIEHITAIEETLKWGEPSYLVKKGSTIRIAYKTKYPNQYAMYFKCTSKLVPTFKEVYGTIFKYEKNRAIVFDKKDKVPEKELKECIEMALNYHSLKNLSRLGK